MDAPGRLEEDEAELFPADLEDEAEFFAADREEGDADSFLEAGRCASVAELRFDGLEDVRRVGGMIDPSS